MTTNRPLNALLRYLRRYFECGRDAIFTQAHLIDPAKTEKQHQDPRTLSHHGMEYCYICLCQIPTAVSSLMK